MLNKIIVPLCVPVLIVLLALGCSRILSQGQGVTVLFSNDIRGEFENCGCDEVQLGGLSRKAHLLRLQANKTPDMLRLDAGNLFFAKQPAHDLEAREFLLKADYIVRAYNAMGCDALNVSDGDLLLGMSAIGELRSKASFPFVSSNILRRDSGAHVFEPAVIKMVGSLRVAILGLCPQDGPFLPELRIQDPVAAVRAMAEKLRGRSDFLIVLSGLGLEADRDLARQATGIDLIISARADRLLESAIMVNGTAIVQAFNRGQYVGKVTAAPSGGHFSVTNQLIALEPGFEEEEAIVRLGASYKAEVVAMNKQAFFKSRLPQPGPAEYASVDSCVECHAPQYENWRETPHARAYQTLVAKGAQYQVECLVCHTTGFGQAGGYAPAHKGQSAMINVQCESCHGPAARHVDAQEPVVRNGGKELCQSCHTEKNSPHFNYDEYLPLVKCPAGGAAYQQGEL